MMPKSITVGELLNNEHYVQVTGDEKSLERPIYVDGSALCSCGDLFT